MRANVSARQELAARVQQALTLPSKKEVEHDVNTVIARVEITLVNNLENF